MKKDIAQSSRTSTEITQREDVALKSRRSMLRGIVAASCALLVPVTFFSSRDVLAETDSASKTKKVSKASVSYQAKPNGEKKCGACANFIASSNTCKRVKGKISPEGWCGLWTQKA
jgi:hypothetical protein